MRIAISTDGGTVSAHFGRCPAFTIVDIEDGKVLHKEEISNPGHHPGFLPRFLHKKGVNCNGTLEGGESLCKPGAGKGYGLDKTECDHS